MSGEVMSSLLEGRIEPLFQGDFDCCTANFVYNSGLLPAEG